MRSLVLPGNFGVVPLRYVLAFAGPVTSGARSFLVAIAAAIERAKGTPGRTELTADWVIDELRKIAGANMADYLKSTTHGDPYRDFFDTDT